ncbi:Nuclear distribution protein NudE [Rasamsonia emersonii CBS 393.64]|uniref:Nuclear distribution protein NudE n=1 Tax=Rasamsonia emersonii (strain ATCC 16479 / CBS 393.64 / IMI 116815) TaxID=1408163 RepID=A0A0F4YSC3_RASE3|nr:Nuclear distribution protein NudE [Rasamsonia emersonii CBS 393.64]KKA21172.1 Nuclear distribution protein NudE [Rasamsonia emersonii CBS 393.64]
MPAADSNNTTPAKTVSSSVEEELAYYKSQYEQLEIELAEFQTSSRELEAELEKDIEASEKRERQLKEKVESLTYEVEEWKTKYKQAKAEANSVQNTLQKEITTLREGNRQLQLKLRDIEVANDDYERQARNTTSSLEDLESKYNVAIERGVLLEEEIKAGEQEREALRIENQRLRDELSDLKIEADIVKEKLRKAEAELSRRRKPAYLDPGLASSQYADRSEQSPVTTASSPTMATPPAKSVSSATSDAVTPPSPTASESSTSVRKPGTEPVVSRARSITNSSNPPRYRRHSRTPSFPKNGNGYSTPSISSRQSVSRLNASQSGIARSGSLYQIRGLIGKMQKLEERVHSARSRLPAPVDTPNGASPRTPSALGQNSVPSSVTVRKGSRKRTSGSSVSSSVRDTDGSSSFIPQAGSLWGLDPLGTAGPVVGRATPVAVPSATARMPVGFHRLVPKAARVTAGRGLRLGTIPPTRRRRAGDRDPRLARIPNRGATGLPTTCRISMKTVTSQPRRLAGAQLTRSTRCECRSPRPEA